MSDNKRIVKIVLTGGPGAGKSSALQFLSRRLGEYGWRVLTVGETASEMISGGVAPWSCGTKNDFQLLRMRLQREKEEIFSRAAQTMENEKILIVCDRGMTDSRSYMTEEVFASACDALGESAVFLRDGYDAVFHLESAAKGAPDAYESGEGTVRRESADEASRLDDALISAWCGHPHLRIIKCRETFEEKAEALVGEVLAYLGDPEPYEIERKYLIKYPDLAALGSDPFCRKIGIEQAYLPLGADGARIRRRGEGGDAVYFYTEKREVTPGRRIEIERRITEDEYRDLMKLAEPGRGALAKDRYCLVYEGKYFEIDVYPFWRDRAIMEIELGREDEAFSFPPHVEVIKDVTEDKEYTNYNLSKKYCK